MPRNASVEIGGTPPKGESKIRRAFCAPDELVTMPREGGCRTMADVLTFAAKEYGPKRGFGYRDVIKVHNEQKEVTKIVEGKEVKETKTWQLYELSDYKYLTFTEFDDLVQKASSGLHNLGLSSQTKFNIYAATSHEWLAMAHSCFRQNIPFCTAYETLGEEGLQHSLAEPEVVGIFTNPHLLDLLAKTLPKTPTVKYVIVNGEPTDEQLNKVRSALEGREGAKVLRLQELVDEGAANPAAPNPPQPDDVACIMYTSGSTGAPKGVILAHSNLLAAVGAVDMLLGDVLVPGDTFLAYLPLAHILEFIVECTFLYAGLPMGYGGVKTLTSASTKNCQGDLQAFAPSIMIGVPAVWEQVKKGINTKVNAGPGAAKIAFNTALTLKKNKIPILAGLADSIVFKKVRQQTGGRLRIALSGGAAISRETQDFLNTALVTLLQGYGLTETCGMCAIMTPEFHKNGLGPVGVPVPAVEIKLKDVPDADYFATDGKGEICLRGPAVTKGYYKRPDVNKESFEDGWFLTGDIGQFNEDGTLSVIDRKKNLVKLAGGEYIALEKLESVYKSNNLVQNLCVVADTNARQPMAVIFPREDALKQFAAAKGLKSADLGAMAHDRQLAGAVKDELVRMGKQNGFKGMELLQTVLIVDEELAMTAAQKLERKKVETKYKDDIKKIYP